MRRASRHSGFSFAELLVVLAILAILLSIFLPYISKVRESERRLRCAENLRLIHHALSAYADKNGHDYPRVRFDPKVAGYTCFTGADAPNPFAPGSSVQANDVTASLWLVVRSGLIEPYRFVCPSSSDAPDPMLTTGRRMAPHDRSNFTDGRNLSYSYSSPFSTAQRYRLNSDVLPADFAVVADKNPGCGGAGDVMGPAYHAPPAKMANANSLNHDRAGQNVLYADGHVQFSDKPYCGYGKGVQRDNIFTALARTPLPVPAPPPPPATPPPPGTPPPPPPPPPPEPTPDANGFCGRDLGPAWEKDSYLVPTASE
jgi:prepilin-type N-terminal cleavage/methylation domain-containing protein/prepilin-type processing-associated H-X9-DG protein